MPERPSKTATPKLHAAKPKIKFSRHIVLQCPDQKGAIEFYKKHFGFEPANPEKNDGVLKAGQYRLRFDKGTALGPIFEVIVPDADAAKKSLTRAGCHTVKWEGKGKACYLRDPYGFVLNVCEDPEAFKA